MLYDDLNFSYNNYTMLHESVIFIYTIHIS